MIQRTRARPRPTLSQLWGAAPSRSVGRRMSPNAAFALRKETVLPHRVSPSGCAASPPTSRGWRWVSQTSDWRGRTCCPAPELPRVPRSSPRRCSTLLTVRFILYPATLARDLSNPVVGGVAPTFAMGWMLVSLSVWQVSHLGWALLLAGCAGRACGLLVGICPASVGPVRARAHEAQRLRPSSRHHRRRGVLLAGPHEGPLFILAVGALYFGIIAYAAMLPLMFYRFIFAENVPVTAMPTLGILAAPASLSLVGYLSLVDDPQPLPVVLLIGIAVLMTSIVYVAFTRLLVLPFSPGYAAYTFPMAIGATALFKTVDQLEAWPIRQKLDRPALWTGGLRVAGRHRSHRLRDSAVRPVRLDAGGGSRRARRPPTSPTARSSPFASPPPARRVSLSRHCRRPETAPTSSAWPTMLPGINRAPPTTACCTA